MFIIVTPGRNYVITADATAIAEITRRRDDFPKPLDFYGVVDLYGKNVVSVEGAVWRLHRKITSPSFNEKNNRLVWGESLHQGQAIIESWMVKGDETEGLSGSIWGVAHDTMRLSLSVISKAGFGRDMLWPHEEERKFGPGGEGLPEGHEMTWTDAMGTLLENVIIVLLMPNVLRGMWRSRRLRLLDALLTDAANLPFKTVRLANKAYLETGKYMREIFNDKKQKVDAEEKEEEGGLDLMGMLSMLVSDSKMANHPLAGALVRGAKKTPSSLEAGVNPNLIKGSMWGTPVSDPNNLFSDNEILGNAFVFLLAGHETVANTLHFTMLLLAMHPTVQRELQQSLDDIFGDRPASEWDYDKDLPKLYNSMTGAIMSEELRLIAPVTGIPKTTNAGQLQHVTLHDGRKIYLPEQSLISITTPALHRNPAYWPKLDENDPNDLCKFKPRRWLNANQPATASNGKTTDEHDEYDDGQTAPSAAAAPTSGPSLFNPPKGAYVPFSEGARSCLGRRFAQVEALAVLAMIFKHYSVELDLAVIDSSLSEDATTYDQNLRSRTSADRSRLWSEARDRSVDRLENGMFTIITLQMRRGKVPIRVVRRGKERLSGDVLGEDTAASF